MFENDERYNAVERPRDREDLFESYMVELERKVRMLHFFSLWTFAVMTHHLNVDLVVSKKAA